MCTPNPCQNGGTCISTSFTTIVCRCPLQYTGFLCQFANPCFSQPCLNNGTCTISGVMNSLVLFKCICSGSFTGDNCANNSLTQCTLNSCFNGGTCNATASNSIRCICTSLFTGSRCEKIYNPCWKADGSATCLNFGICSINLGAPPYYQCGCQYGYFGSNCQFTSTTVSASTLVTTSSGCYDKDPVKCKKYAADNYCGEIYYLDLKRMAVYEYCPISCNSCERLCTDTQASCAVWAGYNLCPELRKISPYSCRKSCGLC